MNSPISKMVLFLLGLALCMIVSAAPAAVDADAPVVLATFLGTPTSATSSNLPTVIATQPKVDPVLVAADLPLPTDYCSTAVYHTNLHRLNHSAPLVTYDQKVAIYASTNIINCPAVLVEEVGSNWAGYLGQGAPPDDVTGLMWAMRDWYDAELPVYEAASNDFTTNPDTSTFGHWGHFSQMVWKDESTIGCWSQPCDASTPFTQASPGMTWGIQIVCASSPAGNMNGAYAANVGPPLGMAPADYTIASNNRCS